MSPYLARIGVVLHRLLRAVPTAWRYDWVFRWAIIGTVLCLLGLLLNNTEQQPLRLHTGNPTNPQANNP